MGGEPQTFFSTTPRLYGLVAEGRARRADRDFKMLAWQAHTIASLERVKKIPPLDKIVGGRDVMPRRTEKRTIGELLSLSRQWHHAIPKGVTHAG